MIGDEQSKRLPTTVPAATLAQFKTEAEKIILAMDAHRPSFLKEPRFCCWRHPIFATKWSIILIIPKNGVAGRSGCDRECSAPIRLSTVLKSFWPRSKSSTDESTELMNGRLTRLRAQMPT